MLQGLRAGVSLDPRENEQGRLCQERVWIKTIVRKLRERMLSVSSLRGRGRELADMMERKKYAECRGPKMKRE